MKEHGAYSSSEAATYEADREVEPLWHLENEFVRALFARSWAESVLNAPVGTGRFLDLYRRRAVTGVIRQKVDGWPLVRAGEMTQEDALVVFDAYLKGNRSPTRSES